MWAYFNYNVLFSRIGFHNSKCCLSAGLIFPRHSPSRGKLRPTKLTMDSNLSLSRRARLLRRWEASDRCTGQASVMCPAPNHHRSCKAVAAAFTAMVVVNLTCFSQAFTPPAGSFEKVRALSSERRCGNKRAWMTSYAHQRSFAERGQTPSWKASSCVPPPLHTRRLCFRRLVLYISYLSNISSNSKLAH